MELLSGEALERYYVDLASVRKTEAIEGVNTLLDFQEAGEFSTLLFTGHRGCGKSTELKRIQNDHYPLLVKVCLCKNVTKDEVGQLMLFNTSVLEYNGSDRY